MQNGTRRSIAGPAVFPILPIIVDLMRMLRLSARPHHGDRRRRMASGEAIDPFDLLRLPEPPEVVGAHGPSPQSLVVMVLALPEKLGGADC
jgi:hypothetical protein